MPHGLAPGSAADENAGGGDRALARSFAWLIQLCWPPPPPFIHKETEAQNCQSDTVHALIGQPPSYDADFDHFLLLPLQAFLTLSQIQR